jgi:hypothetical protein
LTGSLRWTASDPTSTPSRAANDSDWFDVSGDRVGKRRALPLVACFTTDRWDNTVGVCDRFDARLDDGALGSFHDSQRVLQFLQWAAPLPAGARHSGRAARAAPCRLECGWQRAGD